MPTMRALRTIMTIFIALFILVGVSAQAAAPVGALARFATSHAAAAVSAANITANATANANATPAPAPGRPATTFAIDHTDVVGRGAFGKVYGGTATTDGVAVPCVFK